MAGPNLEVFKFGLYILFPIGIMYYFGTNLDNKFSVPDFWPRPEQTNRVPYEKQEIAAELERMKARRLEKRERRLMAEARTQQLQQPTTWQQDNTSAEAAARREGRWISSYFKFGGNKDSS